MKVTVIFQSDPEEEGVDTTALYSHGNVEDLSDLSWVFAEAARAGGYSYVERVTFTTDQGKEFGSSF